MFNNVVRKLVFTGGHHTSALVVAKELQKKGWKILWFGHKHSMWADKSDSAEYREVTSAGIKFYDLHAGKFHRTFNPLKLARIPFGFLQSFWWLFKERPRGIVSFGGYLAVPTVIAGWILGIPAVTHEQTVTRGWANRVIGIFASKIALSWESSRKFYPSNKSEVVGLPVRPEILSMLSEKTGKNSKPVIYVTGGKQGSQTINEVVFSSLSMLARYHIIHQTGNLDYQKALSLESPVYEVFDFDSKKAVSSMYRADVVVSRAGAHTVYELGLLGKKCVLIPIPWVSHQEQEKNAQMLVDAGNAVILSESQLSSETLLASIEEASKLKPSKLALPTDARSQMVSLIESVFGK